MSTVSKANIEVFHDHTMQWVLALFCTKPELYKDYKMYKHCQDYFFGKFQLFAAKYCRVSVEEMVYFGSVRKQAAGEANICGGSGKMSGASSRYFKNRYNNIEKSRENQIDEFAKKYGVSFDSAKPDPRLFLNVTEIWNKLDRIIEIIASSKWADVRELAYDDDSFATPFPKRLEKELVPLDMRNRAMQKFRVSRRTVLSSHTPDIDEGEEDVIVPLPNPLNRKVLVIPEDLDEYDW